jgi:cell volume regulation protein A
MDLVNLPLFAATSLVFLSVMAGLFSTRVGFSFLLVFLLAGILAGEDGVMGWRFDDVVLSFWVGNVALAVILLDGGLRTAVATFRTGLKPAALLATVGVVVSAGVTAAAAMWLMDLDARTAWLMGAIVGSTDAAAVFALLTRTGITLNERVAATLELESGLNDPMAVYLTMACIALLGAQGALPLGDALLDMGASLLRQFGWGGLAGALAGFGMAVLLPRIAPRDVGGGILALLIVAAGLATFAGAGLVGGSGFLAAYLFGLVLFNRAPRAVQPTLAAMDGYAWLAQASMFLLLGLLVTPSKMVDSLLPGLGVAVVLILVARPLAVGLCLWPARFSWREIAFVSWVGLRGAVPIVLALFPLMAGVPRAAELFNVAFVVVLISLTLQGSTIGWAARRLGLALPEIRDEAGQREMFRDFQVDPLAPIGEVCAFYGLPEPAEPGQPVADWLALGLHRAPVVSDHVAHGPAVFVVRSVDAQGRITGVGLGFAGRRDAPSV